MSSSTALRVPSLLALSLALIQPALGETGEPWNPAKHVVKRDYVVPRTTERIPRRLSRRAASTVKPGQPTHTVSDDKILGFEIVGDSGVSGQQLFLGSDTKVLPFPIVPKIIFDLR
jgi:hypothetical protein